MWRWVREGLAPRLARVSWVLAHQSVDPCLTAGFSGVVEAWSLGIDPVAAAFARGVLARATAAVPVEWEGIDNESDQVP